jgi:hypothetical protein
MDKPPITPAIVQPTTAPPAPRTASVKLNEAHRSEKASFESALNRIQDRNSRPVGNNDDKNLEGSLAEQVSELLDELPSDVSDVEDLARPDVHSDSNLTMAGAQNKESESFVIDMTSSDPLSVTGIMVESSTAHGTDTAAVANGRSSTESAIGSETLAQMMSRLEKVSTSQHGQWQFTVVNDPNGVAALQLQRSAQGKWRINVSFSELAVIEEQHTVAELKQALTEQGHSVETITVTRDLPADQS